MIKIGKILLIALACTCSVYGTSEDKVIAKFKGGAVKESDVMNYFKDAPQLQGKKFSEFDAATQKGLLNKYVTIKILDLEVKQSGLEKSPALRVKIDTAKNQLLQQEYISNYLSKHVSKQMIDDEYQALVKEIDGKDELKIRHILTKTEKEAKEARQKLDQGASFAEIAKKYSTDESTKMRGGELGYLMQGQLAPEFEAEAFKTPKGKMSNPVKTQFGWHVIKIDDRRKIKVPSREEANIAMTGRVNQRVAAKLFEELEKKYQVNFLSDSESSK